MGVYINGLEMPKTCCECRMYEADIYYCAAAERDIDIPSSDEGRCSFCPLVPFPPHGRCIDADALIEKCKEMADKEDGNQLNALVLLEWFLEQNAPTIIPAEEADA